MGNEFEYDEPSYDTDTYTDSEINDSDVFDLLDREYDDYGLFQAWLCGTAPTGYNPKRSQWAHKC